MRSVGPRDKSEEPSRAINDHRPGTSGDPRRRAGSAVSTIRRRGNSEGSNPLQRGDGRWQVHIRHTDEDGRSRRYTVYGSTPKEARAKASAVRERLRADLPARDQKVTLGVFGAE